MIIIRSLDQDIFIYSMLLQRSVPVYHALTPGRKLYTYVAKGEVMLKDDLLTAGDGAVVVGETEFFLGTDTAAETLLFDLGR